MHAHIEQTYICCMYYPNWSSSHQDPINISDTRHSEEEKKQNKKKRPTHPNHGSSTILSFERNKLPNRIQLFFTLLTCCKTRKGMPHLQNTTWRMYQTERNTITWPQQHNSSSLLSSKKLPCLRTLQSKLNLHTHN